MLKRLKTILHLIESNNTREIVLELSALKKLQTDDSVLIEIIQLLDTWEYKASIPLIFEYINTHQLTKNSYHSVTGLKTLKSLMETKLSVISLKKLDMEQMLSRFRERNLDDLADLIQQIMEYRVKLLELSDVDDDAEINQAKFDKKVFDDMLDSEIKKPTIHLDKDEVEELRNLYRKASKYCHPDLVDEHLKEQAASYFVELNMAYVYGNLYRVREIAAYLESSEWLKSEIMMDEVGYIEQAISKLGFEIKKIESEINEIKDTPEYKFVLDIKDWDVYFNRLKLKFHSDLNQLKVEYNNKLGNYE